MFLEINLELYLCWNIPTYNYGNSLGNKLPKMNHRIPWFVTFTDFLKLKYA